MVTRGIQHFITFILICFVSVPVVCLGQAPRATIADKSKTIAVKPVEPATVQLDSDQTFELNFDERRFSETDFEASTEVQTNGGSHGLNVRIGVSLTAGRIDVLLRNVRGSVRFRGSLDRILEVLSKRTVSASEVP